MRDCIGSAFNFKGRMECPNCRQVEGGKWLYAFQTGLPFDELHRRVAGLDNVANLHAETERMRHRELLPPQMGSSTPSWDRARRSLVLSSTQASDPYGGTIPQTFFSSDFEDLLDRPDRGWGSSAVPGSTLNVQNTTSARQDGRNWVQLLSTQGLGAYNERTSETSQDSDTGDETTPENYFSPETNDLLERPYTRWGSLSTLQRSFALLESTEAQHTRSTRQESRNAVQPSTQGQDAYGERTSETDFNPGLSTRMYTSLVHDYGETTFPTGLLPEANDLPNRPYGHSGSQAALRSTSLNSRSRRQESRVYERRTHGVTPTQEHGVRATDISAATGRVASSRHSRPQPDERVESQALNARVLPGTQRMRMAVEAQTFGATVSRGTQVMSAELDGFDFAARAMDTRIRQRNQVRPHAHLSTQVTSRRPHQLDAHGQALQERVTQGTQVSIASSRLRLLQVLSGYEALARSAVPDDLAGEHPAPEAGIRHGAPSQGIPSHDWDAEGQALEAGVSHERQAVSVSPHNSDEEGPALEARKH